MTSQFHATIDTKELRAAMRLAEAAAETRPGGIPILSHVWLRFVTDGHLLITGTDLDQSVTVDVMAEGHGDITVAAPALLYAATVASADRVEIEVANTAGASFKAGKMVHKISTLPSSDFPIVVGAPVDGDLSWHIPADDLSRALATCAALAETGTISRSYTHGAWFYFGRHPAIVACDGNALAKIACDALTSKNDGAFLVPTEVLKAISKLAEGAETAIVRLAKEKNSASFLFGNVRLWTKLIDTQSFDYARTIPREFARSFRIDSALTLRTVSRGSAPGRGNSGIRISVRKDCSLLASSTGENGTASDECQISDMEGAPLEFGMNEKYFRWAISSLDSETMEVKGNDAASPFGFYGKRGDADVRIVMPIRI